MRRASCRCLRFIPTNKPPVWAGTLLTAAETYAYRKGARIAELTVVHVRDTLIAWYERQGYRRTGATKAFPYEDPSLGQPLRDDLHFVVLEKPLVA